jgi:signal peptidase
MRRLALVVLRGALVVIAVTTAALVWPLVTGRPSRVIIVSGHSMEPTYHTGDLLLAWPASTYHKGDVMPYRIPADEPGAGGLVIHRVVGRDVDGYVMQGDNNDAPDVWRPTPQDAIGRTVLLVPKVGIALAWIRQPLILAALAAGLVTTTLLLRGGKVSDEAPEELDVVDLRDGDDVIDLHEPVAVGPTIAWRFGDITLQIAAPATDGAAPVLAGWA